MIRVVSDVADTGRLLSSEASVCAGYNYSIINELSRVPRGVFAAMVCFILGESI